MSELFRQVFLPGACIFREGEPGHNAYVIERGSVEISALRAGKKLVIARLEQGELFGEMALIDDGVRSATATALEETSVISIDREQLQSQLNGADPLINLLLRVILDRFRGIQQRMLNPHAFDDHAPVTPPASQDSSYQQARDKVVRRVEFEQEFRRALRDGEFELFYQPIISLRGGHTAGLEALIRWRHPQRGFIPPVDFIGFAEQSGLICPLGAWIFEEAARAVGRFQRIHREAFPDAPPLFMGINVSPRQLIDEERIEEFASLIAKTGVDPVQLKVELTESLMVENPEQAAVALHRLHELGMKVAVDDFGTGYSSLSYLHRFPLDTLKIDRSFVSTMLEDASSQQIVRSIASLAQSLGLEIVAEGIEENAQITLLRDFGCCYGQGYLISKPLPAGEIENLLTRRITWQDGSKV